MIISTIISVIYKLDHSRPTVLFHTPKPCPSVVFEYKAFISLKKRAKSCHSGCYPNRLPLAHTIVVQCAVTAPRLHPSSTEKVPIFKFHRALRNIALSVSMVRRDGLEPPT